MDNLSLNDIDSAESFNVACLTDRSLVARSKEGSHPAFSALIQRHSKTASGMVRKIVRNDADVEDIIQESAMKAYCHISTFDGRSSFSTWFSKIAINTALMLIRKKTARPEMSLDMDFPEGSVFRDTIADRSLNPEQNVIKSQAAEIVRTATSELPQKLRACVERKYLLESTNDEVASRLGISVLATKSRLFRARRLLKGSLTFGGFGELETTNALGRKRP
jgi:RNA polymerase sigma factor (sigma-70 family)